MDASLQALRDPSAPLPWAGPALPRTSSLPADADLPTQRRTSSDFNNSANIPFQDANTAYASGRLSPFLAEKPRLLGRPRVMLHASAATAAMSIPKTNIQGQNEETATNNATEQRGRSPGSTAGGTARPSSSVSSGSPYGDLTAMSHLTIAPTVDTEPPSVPSTTSQPRSSAKPTGSTPPCSPHWPGDTLRVALKSTDGRVVGYRQSSSVHQRFMQLSYGEASGTTPPESPSFMPGAVTLDTDAEFATAAEDPLAGFPDADSRMAGYLLGPVIGRGGFCTVRKGLHLSTGLPVAIKVVDKERVTAKDWDRIHRERRVMRMLSGHVAIVQLLEWSETDRYIYIAMELCAGGSLLDHVRARRRLPEAEASLIFQQLVHALQHCHAHGIVHRDIKLENVLLDGAGGARLIDFGLAGFFTPGSRLRCHCGSPSYAAPEIVGRTEYLAPPVDVWSLGVVLYSMLAGYLPFAGKDKKALSDRIATGVYRTPTCFSAEAADLVTRMLTLDPGWRITLAEVWSHPFVRGGPRWEGPGEGHRGLMRAAGDMPCSSACMVPDDEVLHGCAMQGIDVAALTHALQARECSALTAPYFLLAEMKAAEVRSGGAAAATRLLAGRKSERDRSSSGGMSSMSSGSKSSSTTLVVGRG